MFFFCHYHFLTENGDFTMGSAWSNRAVSANDIGTDIRNGNESKRTFENVILGHISDKDLQTKFIEKKETIIAMATRATERDLIDLSDYINDLGITKKSLEIDIREALVKVYKSAQELTKGMFGISCCHFFFFSFLWYCWYL